MSRHSYWSYREEEAHEQGHKDEQFGRFSNSDFDSHRDNATDRAYFEGREEERRREDRERERQEEERAHQRSLERQREREEEEDYYYRMAQEPPAPEPPEQEPPK